MCYCRCLLAAGFEAQVFGHLAHVRLPFACATMHSALLWPRVGPGVECLASPSLLPFMCQLQPVWPRFICHRPCDSFAFLSFAAGFSDGLLRTRFVRLAAGRCGISWAAGWWTATHFRPLFDQFSALPAPRFSISFEGSYPTNTTTEDLAAQATHVRSDGVRNYLDRLTLDAHLTTLLDTARLEQARGVPAGAPVYSLLHRQATEQVRNYCACWRLDPSLVEAEIPSLGELRRLTVRAVPAATVRRGGWLLTLGLAALAISVALNSD